MASKSVKQAPKSKAKTTVNLFAVKRFSDLPPGHPAMQQLAKNVDSWRAEIEEGKKARAAEAKKPKTLTLTEDDLGIVSSFLSDINLAAASVHRLATSADMASNAGEVCDYTTAIQNVVMVVCRKCDALSEIFDTYPQFGNFEDEFNLKAMRDSRRALRERDAAGADQ